MRETHIFRSTPLVLVLLSACGGSILHQTDLNSLMQETRRVNALATAERDSLTKVRAGRVVVGGTDAQPTLSVELRNAPLGQVIHRALSGVKQPFLIEEQELAGSVTARFENKPLIDGLNLLLSREGFAASLREGMIVIRSATPTASNPADKPDEIITGEVWMEHLDAKGSEAVVDNFLKSGTLKSQYDAARSRVLLWGTRKEVMEATALLHRADSPARHVLIEALVVEFDIETMRNLGISWANGQSGNFSQISIQPGSTSGPLLQFMRQNGVTSPQQFVSVVQAVAGTDKARVVARPYLTARSGEAATVDIGRTRFYITQQLQAGLLSSSATTIPTGVTMLITPTALSGDRVRMDLNITESQFIPTIDNAAAETDKNVVSTSMQVPTGQTIVIGGLALDRESDSQAGIPILRDIPILNLLTAQSSRDRKNLEVVIFITPHIWTPGIDPPILRPELFRADTTTMTKRP